MSDESEPRCSCGLDDSPDGFRHDVVCPKHDGIFITRFRVDTCPVCGVAQSCGAHKRLKPEASAPKRQP